MKWIGCMGLLSAGMLLAGGTWAQAAASAADKPDVVITAFTQPSDRRELSFKTPGIILQDPVKDGDKIKKGQVLLVQDGRMEQQQLAELNLEANSDLEITFAEKDFGVKSATLKRMTQMHAQNVAADSELEEAQLNTERSQTQIKLAKQDKQKKAYEAAAKAFQIEVMTLTSPIDGVVEKVVNKGGEVTDPEKPSIMVVQNDPLWVVMYLPDAAADEIKQDDVFQTRYNDKGEWKPAKLEFMSPVADAKSFRRLVRLELPNPGEKASGYEIFVKLPDHIAAAMSSNDLAVGR